MDLQVFRYIQSEFLVGAISTRRFLCVKYIITQIFVFVCRYGRLGSLSWSELGLHYSYNENSLLSSVRDAKGNSVSYSFNEDKMVRIKPL